MFGLISAYWPYLLGLGFLVGPAASTLLGWGIGWSVMQRRFAGRVAAALSAGWGLVTFIGGLMVLFLWPTTPSNDPTGPVLPGNDVIFRLVDGFALMAGGALALAASLALWGIFELATHSRPRPSPMRDVSFP